MRKRMSKKVYKCIKENTKKYTSRPSPPYPAQECPNKILPGNDGKLYISLSSLETGIYKWHIYTRELIKKSRNRT